MMSGEKCYLAVDIGGTKTALALYAKEDDSFSPLEYARYRSADYDGVEPIISDFLTRSSSRPDTVCVDVAGVVGDTEARVTNLSWVIRKEELLRLGFKRAEMINDMTAVTSSLPILQKDDLVCLQEGAGSSGQVAAVLAPGTGLGEGFLFSVGDRHYPRGTEGGHGDFAPADESQAGLLAWLREKRGSPVSYEMACAGPAICNLFDYHVARGKRPADQVARELETAQDRTPVIVNAALAGTCGLCRTIVDLFLSILGREGANLVLKVYATRGLYLAGGILPRFVDKISFAPFLSAFLQPGPMAPLLGTIPINLVVREDAALLGTACYARTFMKKKSR